MRVMSAVQLLFNLQNKHKVCSDVVCEEELFNRREERFCEHRRRQAENSEQDVINNTVSPCVYKYIIKAYQTSCWVS